MRLGDKSFESDDKSFKRSEKSFDFIDECQKISGKLSEFNDECGERGNQSFTIIDAYLMRKTKSAERIGECWRFN